MQDIRDLVRYEPGVTVANDAARMGRNGVNIRGIGGNRVHAVIDGVRTAEQFDFGPIAVNQYFVDVDTLKSVEIVRSAASSLYGSDALGGLVAFRTKDPGDYLASGTGSFYRVKTGYDGKNDGTDLSLTAAFAHNRFQGLIHATDRRGKAFDNQGTVASFDQNRTLPNDSDSQANQYLLKGVWQFEDGNILRVTADIFNGDTDTSVYSAQGAINEFGLVTEVSDSLAHDDRSRYRLSIDQELDREAVFFDKLSWQIFLQDNATEQQTSERRESAFGPVLQRIQRSGRLTFDQDTIGLSLELQKGMAAAKADYRLSYGLAFNRVRFSQSRDRQDLDLDSGNPDAYTGSLIFPSRYFPNSQVLQGSAYAQLETSFWQDRLKITPGLRYDRHELEPDSNDAIFLNATGGQESPVSSNEDALSPKLGINLRLRDNLILTGQYAGGFRAPPYSSVNNGFTNPAGGYRTLPIADLKPETSENLEFGLKLLDRRGSLNLVYFDNHFDDFIDDAVFLGVGPDGLVEFQPQNVEAVTISGFELAGDLNLSRAWRLKTAFADTEGKDETSGMPLNRIEPRKWVVGLGYRQTENRFGGELTATIAAAKERSEVAGEDLFLTANYQLWDLTMFWNLGKSLALHVGGFNLTDETYHLWTDVNGRTSGDPTLDRYTAPGRSASINLSYQW